MAIKKSACVLLLVVLVFAAGSAEAQLRPRFWIGGSATALIMNGTGYIGADREKVKFDINSSYLDIYVESNIDKVGLDWNDKVLLGLKPAAGIHFNERFGICAAYVAYLKKNSDELYYDTDGLEEITFRFDSEWSQEAVQLLFQYYIEPSSFGFYLSAGLELVNLKYKGTESSEYFDGLDTDWDSETWQGDDSISSLILGFGYDSAPMGRMTLFGALTYSLAKYDDTKLMAGDNLEVRVGGIAADFGVKVFIW